MPSNFLSLFFTGTSTRISPSSEFSNAGLTTVGGDMSGEGLDRGGGGSSGFNNTPPDKPQKDESRLLAYLMKNYDRDVRPVINVNDNVTVHVGITLTQIFDMVSEDR